MIKHIKSLWGRFADLLLPRQCPLCHTTVDSVGVCFTCWETLHFITDPLCDRCGVPLPFETGQGSVCGACFVKEFPLKRLRSLWVYDDASRTLVLRFKTSGQRWLGPVLAGRHSRAWSILFENILTGLFLFRFIVTACGGGDLINPQS